MSVFKGGAEIADCFVGGTPVKEIWKGNTLVWVPVSLSDQSISERRANPNSAQATYQLNTDGNVYAVRNQTGSTLLERYAADPSAYQARVTMVAGTLTIGDATDTWLALTSTRQWGVSQSSVGANDAVFDVEIRRADTLQVMDTARISVSAIVDPN